MTCRGFGSSKRTGVRFIGQLIKVLLMLLSILVIAIPLGAQEGYRYILRGRVVDEKGLAVPHARVLVDAGPPTSWEDFSYFAEADETGNFVFSDDRQTTTSHIRFLYVTRPLPSKAHSPINPPFDRDHRLHGKAFLGRRIAIKVDGETDVGDIPLQIEYGAIHVQLQDHRGRPLLKGPENWRFVWLRIRDAQGKVVSSGGLSINDIEKAVNVRDSSVDITLPEGTWYVDASLREDKGPWMVARVPTRVKPTANRNLRLHLP